MLKSNVKNSAVANWHTRISAHEFNRLNPYILIFSPIFYRFIQSKNVSFWHLVLQLYNDFKP